jgi:hypothetical protein
MSEEPNQNNKTNENDKDVTTNSDIKNEQITLAQKAPTSSSSPSSHFSAHLVTTINRDAIATPHIDNIIEEEEEEEEEKETCLDENVNKNEKTNPNQTHLNESAPNQKQTHVEFSKFTLEPVHLDIESPQPPNKPSMTDTPTKFNIEKIDTSDSSTPILIETNKSTPSTSAKHSLANLQGNVSPIAPHSKAPKSKSSDDDNAEVVEIRVEEGYATRQMDEYFRQTIAAIKEELTKKLENKSEKGGPNKHRNAESGLNTDSDDDDNEFDDYDNETLDNDEANEYSYDHDRLSTECNECMGCCDNFHDKNSSIAHSQHHHRHICNRRNLLYHHLMISSSKKRSKADKANAWLALLGCFLNQFIIEGLCYNYANLFDIVQKEFKTTSKLVSSMPATFLLGFYLLLAPISLFLAKQFGTRRIALIGSFISTVSLLVSSLLNDSIIVFSIFYGILNGIGLSLIYVPSVIATSKWFLKKRLFANSVTILGACLGAAIYPLASEFLLRKYELFDSLLILAGVQLNCVVGSMLLREHKSTLGLTRKKKRKKSQHGGGADEKSYKKAKTKSTSSAHLLENEHTEHKAANGDLSKKQPAAPQTNGDLDKLALVANKRRSLLNDSETESTTASTNTVAANYTLKQYWRKFVQTRKTQANAKKNLFHLIAEEKRKTRTLSKTSLEDGFVITTSNNLLAPNDDSHVIVSRQAAKITQGASQSASSRAASKLFTRIANSLRSLAHSTAASTSSPLATTHHSKNHLAAPLPTTNSNVHEINETSSRKQPALIPLMSVFSGPLNTDTSSAAHEETENNNNNSSSSHIPPNLANVFNVDAPSITLTTANELNQASATSPVELKNEADGCDSDSDEYDEDEGSPNINSFRNKINSGVATNQISRYLSYRNSLANSVRGSLMECSVPEDRENEDELHSGVDGSSHDEDDMLNNNNNNSAGETSIRSKQTSNSSGKRRRVNSQLGNRAHVNGTSPYANLRSHNGRINNTLNSGVNGAAGHNENDSGYAAMPTLTNIRRFLSIMDSSSFYNAPMNLESVEFNLRNSLIKKCSDSYRRNHKYSKKGHDHDRLSLFLSYLSYLTSFKLFKNALLVVLNLSFFFNIIGKFNS